MTQDEKLDKILALLTAAADVPAYERPEIPIDKIDPSTADGVTVQADGSTWNTSKGEHGPAGTIFQTIYGYISPAKNPPMWGRMAACMGEDRLVSLLGARSPFARYKPNVDAYLLTGEANAVTLGYLLSNPLPPPP